MNTNTNFPNWGGVDTAALVGSGLLVVFSALVVIIAFIWVMGKVMKAAENKKKSAEKPAAPKATAAPAPAVKAPVAAAPVEETDGISDEVVVAISAAISAMMLAEGNTKPFAIRSIKRVKESRNAWNAAGVADNTRPF